ncbi:MAG TPA: GNAT family N-acetyltransferase [Flavobacterium sp.]|nr:GNAT family N-acetyltransferase [Flavobacterium sp.]HQX04252.1 GNAT family N-acetyltransferase [Flavobacterium sp.]
MIKIQTAESSQIDEIAGLWCKLMEIHRTFDEDFFSSTDNFIASYMDELEYSIKDTTQNVFVALSDDKMIGYVTASINFPISYYNTNAVCTIGDIMVVEAFQKNGIGDKLVDEVKKWAISKDVKTVQLNVFSKNQKAFAFFNKLNFEPFFTLMQLKITE